MDNKELQKALEQNIKDKIVELYAEIEACKNAYYETVTIEKYGNWPPFNNVIDYLWVENINSDGTKTITFALAKRKQNEV